MKRKNKKRKNRNKKSNVNSPSLPAQGSPASSSNDSRSNTPIYTSKAFKNEIPELLLEGSFKMGSLPPKIEEKDGKGLKNSSKEALKELLSEEENEIDSLNSSLEIKNNEIICLQSIYMEDLEVQVEPSATNRGELKIKIVPNRNEHSKNYCWINLKIKYRKGYPYKTPIILIEEHEGIEQADVRKIKNAIQSKADQLSKIGTEMLFDLCDVASDALKEYNRQPIMGSLYDEMMKALKIKEQQEQESKERKKQQKLALEEEEKHKMQEEIKEYKEEQCRRSLIEDIYFYKDNIDELDEEAFQMPDFKLDNNHQSRFRSDFEEVEAIGKGGAGAVFKARNKVDRILYAIKKVKLSTKNERSNEILLREVTTLSRLDHIHIVRYYQAWIEEKNQSDDSDTSSEESDDIFNDESTDTLRKIKETDEEDTSRDSDEEYVSFSEDEDDDDGAIIFKDSSDCRVFSKEDSWKSKDISKGNVVENEKRIKKLYIQMEYCPGKTLRDFINESALLDNDEAKWRLLRQILEALSYMHERGMIHRDLKPSNIFLDKNYNVKLGDLGLAKIQKKAVDEKLGTASKKHSVDEETKMNPSTSSTNTTLTHISLNSSISELSLTQTFSSDKSNSMQSLSAGVGTPYYISPEQEKGSRCNEKTDIYSLGIIIFEMWYRPFQFLMERDKTLTALRNSLEFPNDFKVPPEVKELILLCLRKNPNERPKSNELLQSELMPPRFEDEAFRKFIESISNHKTVESTKLMKYLFSQRKNPIYMEKSYDYFLPQNLSNLDHILNQQHTLKDKIFKIMTNIFQSHGAAYIEPHEFYPVKSSWTIFTKSNSNNEKGKLISIDLSKQKGASPLQKNQPKKILSSNSDYHLQLVQYNNLNNSSVSATFLKESGLLLQLPTSLKIPWARFVAIEKIQNIKRYLIGKIYHNKKQAGNNVHESYKASFDIIAPWAPPGNHLQDEIFIEAEVLKVAEQVIQEFSLLKDYKIKINSTGLIDFLLQEVQVENNLRIKVYQTISFINKKPWNVLKKELIVGCQMKPDKVEKLGSFIYTCGTIEDIENLFAQQDKFSKRNQLLEHTLSHFHKLMENCEAFKMDMSTIIIDLSLMPTDLSTHSGLFFQICTMSQKQTQESKIHKKFQKYGGYTTIIANGGRYDNEITHFQLPDLYKPTIGMGIEFYCEKIITAYIHQGNRNVVSTLDAYVMSNDTSPELVKQRRKQMCEILRHLWKGGIRAEGDFIERKNRFELQEYCKSKNVRFLINLQEDSQKVKIKDIFLKNQEEIPFDMIEEYIKGALPKRSQF